MKLQLLAGFLCALWPLVGSASAAETSPTTRPMAAAIIASYPARDVPVYTAALTARGVKVDTFTQEWLPVDQYANYSTVVVVGALTRAPMEKKAFTAEDLPKLQKFMEDGGTLILGRDGTSIFRSADVGKFFNRLLSTARADQTTEKKLIKPEHPWVAHLASVSEVSWLSTAAVAIRTTKGEVVIGSQEGDALLFRAPVGKGQAIYVGWDFSRFYPQGANAKPTPEEQQRYDAQYQILTAIVAGLYPTEGQK